MTNKKALIKEIKATCSIELNTKKLNSMNQEQLEDVLNDLKLLKGEGWRDVINKNMNMRGGS